MQQLTRMWANLSVRNRIMVSLSTVAMFVGVLAMSSLATRPDMVLLYAGLESGAAGEVINALEQRGVPFEVRGGAILVQDSARDELRLTLASEGLPATGSKGYELLDNLTGFGTTSQMFDATYWRAKEGELARTIVSSAQIAAARVHIAGTGSNPFQRSVTPTASVLVTTSNGGISSAQAKALRYLVASAVAGLLPENVAVMDADGGIIDGENTESASLQGESKASVLREKVERLLEARVGRGNAIVEISVDTVMDSETLTEKRLDPKSRVAISTDTEERNDSSADGAGGDVTVASNLPGNDAAGSGDSSSSSSSESRERINYDFSETERKVLRASGGIKRLTVAVLVNNRMATDENGAQITVERDKEELEALRELISSAVGFDAERGDLITLKSMELTENPVEGTLVTGSLLDSLQINLMSLIKMSLLAVVVLILGLFLLRPLLLKQVQRGVLDDSAGVIRGKSLSGPESPQLPQQMAQSEEALFPSEIFDAEDVLPPEASSLSRDEKKKLASENQVERLRGMIGDKQEETIEILRTWLEEKEENA